MGKKYKCSYCKEKGHNIRRCPEHHNSTVVSANKTLRMRTRLKEICIKQGFGIGCIVLVDMRLWDNTMHEYINVNTVGIVEDIFWKHLFWKHLLGDRGMNGAVKISFTHPKTNIRAYITTALPPTIQAELGIESSFVRRAILEIVGKTEHLGIPEDFLDLEKIKEEESARLK